MTHRPGRVRRRLGLESQLLGLLLAFGAIPLAVVVLVGYQVTRQAMIDQAERSLQELAHRQADYVVNEIRRQQLLLRTITGQIAAAVPRLSQDEWTDLLRVSLADDGVFDGLRLVRSSGQVAADVALRRTAPHWPERHGEWTTSQRDVTLHRDSSGVIAYVLAARARFGRDSLWLGGHVRAEDFVRLFDIPLHPLGGLELAIFDREGNPIAIPHAHAGALRSLVLNQERGASDVIHATIDDEPVIASTTSIAQIDWVLVASLPLDVVLAPVVRMRNIAIFGCLALIALVFGAAHLAARVITTPLRDLSLAATDLGRTGSYDLIRRGGVAETETLVDSFNEMATALRQSREEVERLHAQEMERAQQLATVGELASGVAHEIRNPLTGVLGALEFAVRRMPEQDNARPLLQEAEAQLHRIESTTTRLLEYARPPEMRQLIVDANGLAERGIHIVEARARAGTVLVDFRPAPTPLLVRADPELIVQVIINLLLNAIEAMPQGGGLQLAVGRSRGNATICVSDDGPGIPIERRADIFRPFFTTKNQGTGLGLSISSQIMKRHGGTLRLVEPRGRGAAFVVSLPLQSEDGADS